MAQFKVAGRDGKVYVGGLEIPVTNINWTFNCNTFETTSTSSQGWVQRAPGLFDSEGSFEMQLDADNLPSDFAIDYGSIVTLKVDITETIWKAGEVIVESLELGYEANNPGTVTVNFQGNSAVSGSL